MRGACFVRERANRQRLESPERCCNPQRRQRQRAGRRRRARTPGPLDRSGGKPRSISGRAGRASWWYQCVAERWGALDLNAHSGQVFAGRTTGTTSHASRDRATVCAGARTSGRAEPSRRRARDRTADPAIHPARLPRRRERPGDGRGRAHDRRRGCGGRGTRPGG